MDDELLSSGLLIFKSRSADGRFSRHEAITLGIYCICRSIDYRISERLRFGSWSANLLFVSTSGLSEFDPRDNFSERTTFCERL
jgi:hypothetical protein